MWSEPGGLREARQPVGGFSGWPGPFAQPPSQHMRFRVLVHPQGLWAPYCDLQSILSHSPASETAIFGGRLAQGDGVILTRAKGCGAGEEGVGWGECAV